VAMDEEQTAKLRAKWGKWGGDVPLVVLDSPYRSLVRPLLRYLGAAVPPQPGCGVGTLSVGTVASRLALSEDCRLFSVLCSLLV